MTLISGTTTGLQVCQREIDEKKDPLTDFDKLPVRSLPWITSFQTSGMEPKSISWSPDPILEIILGHFYSLFLVQ